MSATTLRFRHAVVTGAETKESVPYVPLLKPLFLKGPRPLLQDFSLSLLGHLITIIFIIPTLLALALRLALFRGGSGRVQRRGSATAMFVCMRRHSHSLVGLCDDEYAAVFLPAGAWLASTCLALHEFLLGGGGPLANAYLGARTKFMDAFLEHNAHHFAVQNVVILGAGFDSRVYRLRLPQNVRFWEVDAPTTQAEKLRLVVKAGLRPRYPLRHVAVDFSRESWLEKLQEEGFRTEERTLFVTEGLLYYLAEADVRETFRLISQCGRGSMVAFDYFTRDIADGSYAPETPQRDVRRAEWTRMSVKSLGEPFRFGASMQDIEELMQEYGLEIHTHVDDRTMTTVYGTRGFDQQTGRGGNVVAKMPFYARLCMAEVKLTKR